MVSERQLESVGGCAALGSPLPLRCILWNEQTRIAKAVALPTVAFRVMIWFVIPTAEASDVLNTS